MRRPLTLLLALSAAILLLWWLPNRAVDPEPGVHVRKFNSLSYASYRDGDSPFDETFATEAEVDQDFALLAPITRAVRTYSALEGTFDTAAIARKHGLKLWQGIWLGSDPVQNDAEIARGIALARRYPDTIERVVVGNEVLLRRDLPVAALIADIDRVRRAVKQPVAYADVWEFWKQFPQVASHVDVVLVHLLPYWEDVPTGIDRAVAHVDDVYRQMRALFPGKVVAIGETGWPSRGRPRRDAVPGRVNEAHFLRQFIALSQAEHFDYNFIEAFDQRWKYASEGIVGANWGVMHADRTPKIPLAGPLREDPLWAWHALVSIGAGLALSGLGLVTARGRGDARAICAAGMGLGAGLGYAAAGSLATLYDVHLEIACAVNLPAQLLLAVLAMLRLAGAVPPAPPRGAAEATQSVRTLLRRFALPPRAVWFEDLQIVFAWTAMVMQLLLVFDPRYREFPLGTFAVPLLVAAIETAGGGTRRAIGRLDVALVVTLAGGAIASAIQEGPLNGASLTWNACALGLALYHAGWRLAPRRVSVFRTLPQ